MRHPIVFGKYLLLERISVGGMAEVFKAKSFGEEGFEKILAIKRILPSMVEDEEFIEMFIDEAKISGQLSHPNIGQIFELGKIDNSYFIAMEYVWGKDVLQIQNRFKRVRKKMTVPMAAFIASRVCEGLEYAHRKKDEQQAPLNIIHRDISPQNILVSYAGEVKIIDFGIAKARSRSSKTQAGVLKGKFGYMSPEQVRGLPVDQRTDIFSVGTLLYEMTTGERLFTGESDFAILEKVRNAIVPSPSKVAPNMPSEIERIILKALKRNPDERYSWASEIQEELNAFLMSHDPIFNSKDLSSIVTQLFEEERQREMAAIERYKQIKADDLDRFQAQPYVKREIAISLLPNGPSNISGIEESYEDQELQTDIGGPSFLIQESESQSDSEPEFLLSSDLIEEVEDEEDEDNKTSIYADRTGESAIADPLPGEPTYIFNMESGKMMQFAEHPTVIFYNAGGNGNLQTGALNQGPTVIFDANHSEYRSAGVQITGKPTTGTLPVTLKDRSPSLFKDIMIGVLLAVVIILGAAMWRVFSTQVKDPNRPSIMVISTIPPIEAKVMLNGEFRGSIKAGTPLMIKGLSPKLYRVKLIYNGASSLERSVDLKSGEIQNVNLRLPMPIPFGNLDLTLNPSDATLLVDGAEVHLDADGKPIKVSPKVNHDVRVEKTGYKTKSFSVTIRPGETLKRTVTLEEEETSRLRVKSIPTGAKVWVDGKERGTTPLRIEQIAVGIHELKLALDGYNTTGDQVVVKRARKTTSVSFTLKRQSEPRIGKAKEKEIRRSEGKEKASVDSQKSKIEKKKIKVSHLGPTGSDGMSAKNKEGNEHLKSGGGEAKGSKGGKGKKGGKETDALGSEKNVGYLVANTIPWAKVIIDGEDTGRTTPVAPRSKISLKPGKHKVTFVVEGKQFHFDIQITVGKTARLIKKLPVN